MQELFRETPQRKGKRASFKTYWNNTKLKRGQGKGIGWYRYQTYVLKPLLLPFAQEMKRIRTGTIV